MSKQNRDLNHFRRLAGIPVDLSKLQIPAKAEKPDSKFVTEAAKVPQHRGELAPKTKKNMRDRVSCAKKALEYLESAREELMKLPAVDYMEDIPDVIRQLHQMLHGEDGTGGLHHLHRLYDREFNDSDYPEELENTEPGMDGNPTEQEIKEKERAKKAKKNVREGQAIDNVLQNKNAQVNSIQNIAQQMRGEDGNTADNPAEQEEKSKKKPKWLEKAEVDAEEKQGEHISAAEKEKVHSEQEEKSKKKPEWLEKAEVKAEEKEHKSVSKEEKKKVGESVGITSRPLFTTAKNKDWLKPGSDVNKKFAADAEFNKNPQAHMATTDSPVNVVKQDDIDTAYPQSNRSEGPNQVTTNPYNESQKVHVPDTIKNALKTEADSAQHQSEMFASRKDLDSKNFYEDMAKAFYELHMKLEEGTVYSIKEAQILMTSMMNIFTTKIPPDVVKFIAAGGTVRPLKDYLKQVTGNFDQWHIHPDGDKGHHID